MTNFNPLISVIIPVYNCEKYIDEAIDCALSQNYKPVEIIIIDDGSTDNSAAIAKRYKKKIRYINQNNKGPAAARNAGIKIATGEFIAFLDADDLWPENKIELHLPNFKNDIELEISMGRIKYVELPGAKRNNRIPLDSNDSFKYVNLGAGLFKKSVFDKVGYFDEEFIYWEDLDWFLKAYEDNCQITFLDEITMFYRIHSNNMSNDNNKKGPRFFNKALRNSLRRRKKKSHSINIEPINNFFELSK